MYRPFQRTRHIRRYQEIVQVLAWHGFGDVVNRLGLAERLSLPRRILRQAGQSLPDTPARVRLVLEELGPTFIKLGQILSTRPDLLPPPYIAELAKLQDTVPPALWESIRRRIEEELEDSLEKVFADIDPEPLAAASLSQVHAAHLPDGTEVVVKIQRPDIERTIETDLAILFDLANLLQTHTPLGEIADLPAIAEDFASTLHIELDYRREGQHAERFRRNFADEPYLYIPHIHWAYTTRRVLVMERIRGVKINDLAGLSAAGCDRHRVALRAAHIIVKEVLEDGFFHADPHPGNFVVMEGEVIGAMDFGMVGWLESRDRLNLIQLYIAAVRLDADSIVNRMIRMGVTDSAVDHEGLRRDIAHLLRKYHGLPLKDIRAGEVIEEIMPIVFRHHLNLPSDLWLLGKVAAMMEGVGLKLDPDFDVFAVSEPYVKRLSQEMLLPRTWGPSLVKSVDNWANLLMLAPQAGSGILRQLERGQFQLVIEHKDIKQSLTHLDSITGRLTVSILVAALIIGLALVIPVAGLDGGGRWMLALLILAFAAASSLGLWLLISILRTGT